MNKYTYNYIYIFFVLFFFPYCNSKSPKKGFSGNDAPPVGLPIKIAIWWWLGRWCRQGTSQSSCKCPKSPQRRLPAREMVLGWNANLSARGPTGSPGCVTNSRPEPWMWSNFKPDSNKFSVARLQNMFQSAVGDIAKTVTTNGCKTENLVVHANNDNFSYMIVAICSDLMLARQKIAQGEESSKARGKKLRKVHANRNCCMRIEVSSGGN